MKNEAPEFSSYKEFYPFYLAQHSHPVSRRLHFIGLLLALVWLALVIGIGWPVYWLFGSPVLGYGSGFIGHFGFEKNKPATFRNPLYSFAGDFNMFLDILRGKIRF
ncbi:MAG: Mpo1-like protein [Bacteroidia bacterium]